MSMPMQEQHTVSHPQGQVVGNRIYYNNNSSCGHFCQIQYFDRRKACVMIVIMLFLFGIAVANFAVDVIISGLVFLSFSIIILSFLICTYVRQERARNQGMQPNVTYNQVPGQAIPGQNQGPTYPAVHIHPPQQYTIQPYPTQQPSAPTYPSQGYPSHVTQAQPPTQTPSMFPVPMQGVQAPLQPTGEPLAQPPPPTYEEAMNLTEK